MSPRRAALRRWSVAAAGYVAMLMALGSTLYIITVVPGFGPWQWLTVIFSLLLMVIGSVMSWFGHQLAQPGGHGNCRNCGYDLRASHEQCPECGTPI